MLTKKRLLEDVVLAWLMSMTLVVVAAYAAGVNPWSVHSFDRSDSGFYLGIAAQGYNLYPCEDDPSRWCGNAGWMPGLSFLVWLVENLGMNDRGAGFLISNVFFIGCLILLRRIIEQIAPDSANRVCFFSAAVSPGGIYLHAIYPLSMLMFCAVLSLILLSQRRFLWASIASAWGALSYATGFLLAGVVGSAVIIADDSPWPRRLSRAAIYGAIAFSGLLAVMIMQQIVTNHWNAFFLVQAKYGHGIHDPLLVIPRFWEDLRRNYANFREVARPAQSLLICAMVPTLLAFLLRHRREITRIEWLAAIQVCLFWIFPLIMGTGVYFPRAEATLLPLTLLTVRLPGALQLPILIVFAGLYFGSSVAFFIRG
jgi:hypothetical protein